MGHKPGADQLRRELIDELKKKDFHVTASASKADQILTGEGELYLKGYSSLNPRSGILPRPNEALYSGSLSLELKDRQGDTVWSYLATPKSAERNAAQALAKDAVKHLIDRATKPPAGKRR